MTPMAFAILISLPIVAAALAKRLIRTQKRLAAMTPEERAADDARLLAEADEAWPKIDGRP